MARMFIRFKDGKSKAFTFSFDDGVVQDMAFIKMLEKYNLKCTFNLNSARFVKRDHVYPEGTIWRAMVEDDVLATYSSPYCSVACHSAHHPTLKNMSEAEIAEEILSDRRAHEARFGKIINGMALPNGPYDETTIKVLKMCGIKYARTVMGTQKFDIPREFVPFNPTCHYISMAKFIDEFLTTEPKEDGYLFYVWGHTYEFDRDNKWELIEENMKKISGYDNVWYADNDEIFNYIEKFRKLVTSANGRLVSNPTDTEIWFSTGSTTYSVKPGETISL